MFNGRFAGVPLRHSINTNVMKPMEDTLRPIDEQLSMMESILISRATGGSPNGGAYRVIRQNIMADSVLCELLPRFVRVHRDLDAFWSFIKNEAPTYEERRGIIRAGFTPIMDHVEGRARAPGDVATSDALQSFDADGVYAVWAKAMARRKTDPEGAITVARTLLETVSKRILDEMGESYTDKEDLPKLYGRAAKSLNLAPSQHGEEPIRMILGGAMQVANGIGTLRNRLSDAHGRGGRKPVRPTERHASLAVNTAGAIAAFLVETFADRHR